jgi:hypothetical protein
MWDYSQQATQSVSTRSSSDISQDEDYCSFFDDDDDFFTVEFTRTTGHTIPQTQEVKRGWIQSTYISMFGMCGLFEDDAEALQLELDAGQESWEQHSASSLGTTSTYGNTRIERLTTLPPLAKTDHSW